jgi:hypothetical protein
MRLEPPLAVRPPGALLVAGVGAAAFLLAGLPVTDLNAADARAAAVAHGVGPTYWFSWFGGNVPARYSVLIPLTSHLLGVRVIAALGVLTIAALLPTLLVGTVRPVAATYLGVVAALANLWSGRVAFCVGAALGVAAALALSRRMPWVAGVVNLLGALVSGLPAAFVLLAASGLILTGRLRPSQVWPFAGLTMVGLAIPLLLFGDPGPLPFDGWTLTRVLIILVSALAIRPPPQLRWTLVVTIVVCLALYVLPTGIGNNMSRFACYLVPAMVWAVSRQRRTLVLLAVLPALLYTGWTLGGDVQKSLQPSAQPSYDTALMRELATQPDILNQRIEALDTPTHRPSADLAAKFFLARGWEAQSDAAANSIMYQPLTATEYRQWLDNLAVGWVAVPDDVNPANANEAVLISGGLGYLHKIWQNAHWTLYAVQNPQQIAPAPATLVSRSPSTLDIAVPQATKAVLRIRPSPYLRVFPLVAGGLPGSISRLNDTSVIVQLPRAGTYRISSAFDLDGVRSRLTPK